MKKTIIINLFSGPSVGKSTTAAGIFHRLKVNAINCEYVPEYAKDVTWQENFNTLKNQLYVFAKQHNRMFHLKDKVDVIVTDSPAIMGLVYCDFTKVSPSLETLVVDEFHRDDICNMNFFLRRVHKYSTKGRKQNEAEAKELDAKIFALLDKHNVQYGTIDGNEEAVDYIVAEVLERIKNDLDC